MTNPEDATLLSPNPNVLHGRGVCWMNRYNYPTQCGNVVASLGDDHYLIALILLTGNTHYPRGQIVVHISELAATHRDGGKMVILYDDHDNLQDEIRRRFPEFCAEQAAKAKKEGRSAN